MKTRQHLYEDPTGGGDDVILTVPMWIDDVPSTIVGYQNSERYDFRYAGEQESDDAPIQ